MAWKQSRSNFQKHGATFDEAKTVFDDSLASIFDDVWHSFSEQRELIIGLSNKSKLLVVSFTERTDGVIRIISARMATTVEIKNHERTNTEDLLPEYNFDYSKAKPNRFAKKTINVTLDEDVAKVFTDSESVNKALRAILTALPKQLTT